MGTCNTPRTTSTIDAATATRITSAFDQTLATAISNADSGMTSRCSIVPCSRSRISAAPVRTVVSSVTWLTRATMLLNQLVSPLGLNALRITSFAGAWKPASARERNSETWSDRMFWM